MSLNDSNQNQLEKSCLALQQFHDRASKINLPALLEKFTNFIKKQQELQQELKASKETITKLTEENKLLRQKLAKSTKLPNQPSTRHESTHLFVDICGYLTGDDIVECYGAKGRGYALLRLEDPTDTKVIRLKSEFTLNFNQIYCNKLLLFNCNNGEMRNIIRFYRQNRPGNRNSKIRVKFDVRKKCLSEEIEAVNIRLNKDCRVKESIKKRRLTSPCTVILGYKVQNL